MYIYFTALRYWGKATFIQKKTCDLGCDVTVCPLDVYGAAGQVR